MKPTSKILMTMVFVSFLAAPAFAGGMASSKTSAAMGGLTPLGQATAETRLLNGDEGYETPWTTVLHSYIKTANDSDLAFDVAIQCGISTFTAVRSKGGSKDGASAHGTVSIRVKVTDEDGNVRYAGPGEGGVPENGVIYCHRTQTLTATFQGLIEDCINDDGTISLSDECLLPEEVSLLLDTLNANAFNFLLADVISGVHHIEVEAKAVADEELFGTGQGDAKGEAFVGLGSMHVEETRLIKGEDGFSDL
jgi:hypothetical protein